MLSKPKSTLSSSNEENSCFESAIVDSFRCSLCLNVLRNPVQCQRNEHHFCKSCIERHLKKSAVCPCCKDDLSLETLLPAPQILIKLLSQLKVRCDYNERGCKGIMKVAELENHHKVCAFAPVVCPNKDCREVVNRSALASHQTETCQFRLVQCSVCDETLVFRWYKMHSCVLRTDIEEMKSSMKEIQASVREILSLITPLVGYTFQGIKRNIIVCGGKGCTDSELYDWKTRKWIKQRQPMKFSLEYGSSFIYQGELLVSGVTDQGCSSRSDAIKAIALDENFAESGWKSTLASLPYNCYAHATVLFNDSFLVFGGCQSSFLDGVYQVQLISPYKSKLLCRMPEARCHHGVGLFGDKIVLIGGQTKDGVSKDVLMYDLSKNKWKKLGPLEKPVMKMATVCWKDNVILLGGQNDPSDFTYPLSDVVMYNITSEKITKLPSMREARSSCAAVIIGNTVVALGGHIRIQDPNYDNYSGQQQYTSKPIKTVEYFSFECNSWEQLPAMNVARQGATAHAC